MRLDRRIKLVNGEGKQGVFLEGECQIGHKRRCPNTVIEPAVSLGTGCEVEAAFVGMGVYIGRGTSLRRVESIGRFTTIGEGCRIGVLEPEKMDLFSNALPLRDNHLSWSRELLPIEHPLKRQNPGRVRIGNDVWIGEGTILLEGISIGDGAVVRPGSVVREDVPPYGIFSGNPGRLEGLRFSKETIERLEEARWWDYGTRLLKETKLELLSCGEILGEIEGERQPAREKLPYGLGGFWFCHKGGLCSVYTGSEEAMSQELWKPFGKRKLLLQFPDN